MAIVEYELADGIAAVTMDDGKANVLSPTMLGELGGALDRAESDEAVVVLAGRDGRFSGGFDLATLQAGGRTAVEMLRGGFELAERLLTFPRPVVVECTGHAIAMGLFVLLSGDYRVGADGPFKLTANEVAIGLPLPMTAVEILRQRLTPAHFTRAAILAEVYAPQDAVAAGMLDRVVAPADLHDTALGLARDFAQLDAAAHLATKLRVRATAVEALRAAIESELPLR